MSKLSAAAMLVIWLVAACGGPLQTTVDLSGNAAGSPDNAASASQLLPAPASLPRLVATAPGDEDRFNSGVANNPNLPHNNTTAESFMTFASTWIAEASSPADLAYAGYIFPNMNDYSEDDGIRLAFNLEPVDFGNLYVAVADYTLDTWHWFPVDSTGYASAPGLKNMVSPNGNLVVEVLLMGTDYMELDWLIIGDRLSIHVSINSDLNPDPSQNVAPLTVNFTAFGWLYGGDVVSYDFDYEDDGVWDLTGSTTGMAGYDYNSAGSHRCRIWAHDDAGRTAEAILEFELADPQL